MEVKILILDELSILGFTLNKKLIEITEQLLFCFLYTEEIDQ